MYLILVQIKLPSQMNAAIKYFKDIESKDFNLNEFEEACGVGTKSFRCNHDSIF